MATKFFCDHCHKQIKSPSDRVRRIKGEIMIEVMVRYENTWNAGHICDACVIDVVKTGRPAKGDESWLGDQIRKRRTAA